MMSNAQKRGIDIKSGNLPGNVSGLYFSNGKDKLIGLSVNLQTRAEQACVLAISIHVLLAENDGIKWCCVTS